MEPAKLHGLRLGPESTERTFEVLYLDRRVRVVEFLPDKSAKSSEPVLFVLRRLSKVHANTQVSWSLLQQQMTGAIEFKLMESVYTSCREKTQIGSWYQDLHVQEFL